MNSNGDKKRKYTGKTVDEQKFIDVITYYFQGGHTQTECAKMLGVTSGTFVRWGTMLWENDYKVEGLPFLVKDKDKNEAKAKRDKRNAWRREYYRRNHPKKEKHGKQGTDTDNSKL